MTTIPAPEPLPRSLVPLPDEVLSGFLLRLCHRLDRTPTQMAERTGLISPHIYGSVVSRLNQGDLLQLPDRAVAAFAQTARIDPQAVRSLTLEAYRDRYPPIEDTLTQRRRNLHSTWLNLASPRCCPRCLAGDGSEIQRRHGGPWKIQWHLGVVFACPEHNTFLRTSCPRCHQPLQSSTSTFMRMMASSGAAGLHPAQCRNRPPGARGGQVCGTRLDRLTPFRSQRLPALDPQSAALQQRLLNLLAPTSDPARSTEVFAELKILTSIVTAAWPHRLDVPVPEPLLRALDTHVTQQNSGSAPRLRDNTIRATRATVWSAAPASMPATAALLVLADHCRNLPRHERRTQLAQLMQHAPYLGHPRWGRVWEHLHRCSKEFADDVTAATAGRQPPVPPWPDFLDGCMIPIQRRGYLPKHVPQEIPRDWIDRFFTGLKHYTVFSSRPLRRAIALQLVQAATRMSAREAAIFLGFDPAWLTDRKQALLSLQSLFEMGADLDIDITTGLEKIAEHLGGLPEQTDYHERRQRFSTWQLSPEQWHELRNSTPVAARISTEDAALRISASAYIWSRITGSEWILAPSLKPPPNPPVKTTTQGAKTFRGSIHIRNEYIETKIAQLSRRSTALARLAAALDHIAGQLADHQADPEQYHPQ